VESFVIGIFLWATLIILLKIWGAKANRTRSFHPHRSISSSHKTRSLEQVEQIFWPHPDFICRQWQKIEMHGPPKLSEAVLLFLTIGSLAPICACGAAHLPNRISHPLP